MGALHRIVAFAAVGYGICWLGAGGLNTKTRHCRAWRSRSRTKPELGRLAITQPEQQKPARVRQS